MMKLLSLAVMYPVLLCGQGPLPADYPVSAGDETNAEAPSVPASANAVPIVPLTVRQKTTRRAFRLVEPITLVNSALGGGIEQWRNVPPQWGQGSEGYAKRFASAEGFTAAHNGIALGFDVAFHLDPRYRRMPEGTVKERIWNAVSQTFIANKDGGGRMINVSEIAGNFGAGFVTNTWEPQGYNRTSDALTRGVLGLAYHTGKNVIREFLPDLLHRGKQQPVYAWITGTATTD
jgi:hypothetical protein